MKTPLVLLLFVALASLGRADVASDIEALRVQYELPPLKQGAPREFVFRIYVRPSFSNPYVVEGKVVASESGQPVSGNLALFKPSYERSFSLSAAQAREVMTWFMEARFDPSAKETLDGVLVADGVSLLVEGFMGEKPFRLRRNSGDSTVSGTFFKRVDAFRLWKE